MTGFSNGHFGKAFHIWSMHFHKAVGMTEVVSLPIGHVASQRQSLQATRESVLCGVHVHSYNSHVYSTQSDDSSNYMCRFSHCYIAIYM